MGFDNECILNIPSLPGEYFCPVCRTLITPNEALQAQCTHLYCKPCLTYVVATTQACPYDGYLVTEADSKPLMESNKSLAETIGKVTVHCLYHKSGCQWQGQLSDCIMHGTTCAYGNSPVVCNRCGTQIVHRQVQEHAQLCPGQTQSQQADSSLTQSSAATTQAVTPYPAAVTPAAPAVAVTAPPAATLPSAVTASSAGATTASTMAVASSFVAAPIATSQGQGVAPQTPTAEKYQQQLHYQQYYQQHYPGYNPYMQQYQQYGQYQQYTQPQMQVAPQNTAQAPAQSARYVQPQVLHPSQPQHMVPSQSQNQSCLPQSQAQAVQQQPQHNPPLQSAPQIPQMQPQSQVPLQLPRPQAHPTAYPPVPTQVGSQPFAMPATQATPSQVQPHVQPHPPEYQQVLSQQQHPRLQHLPQQQHLQPHIQLNSQIQHQHPQVQQQACPQPQVYHQPHPMPHVQPQNPPVHAVTSHQSYPQPQPAHQMLQSAPLQHPIHVSHQQVVGSQHRALIHPPQGQYPLQGQQSTMPPQGTQPAPQHQQHVGHHAQRPPMLPSQAPQQGFPLNTSDCADSSDKGKGNDEFVGRESNSHGPDVQGHKESMASDASNDLEKRGSSQQVSQQNLRAPGSSSMGPEHPSEPDRMLPHHMLHPGSMPHVQGQPNQMRPPKHSFPENIWPPMQQQPYGSYYSEMAPRAPVPNQNKTPIPQPATIRPNDGMVRPPMGGPLPGQHDTTVPPFASEYVARPHPLGMAKSNGVGVGPLGSSRAFHEGGLNSSQEHFRPFAAYPGRHNANLKDIEENMKEFSGPTHLEGEGPQRVPRPFEGGLGRPDGFADSLPGRPPFPNQPGPYPIGFFEEFARKPHSTVGHPDFVSPGAEFGYHRIDGMPTLRNTGGHGGLREDQLGSGNVPGNVQHDFRGPEFPHARFHPGDSFAPRNLHSGGPLGHGQLHGIEPSGYHYQGHMHPDDHFTIDYSRHGFQKESGHFGLGGHLRNEDAGWCRICKFNCGSMENLDLHVHTRKHQQFAMDIVLKMKHEVAKNQKMNSGGPRSFNKKVAGKGNVRGNRR